MPPLAIAALFLPHPIDTGLAKPNGKMEKSLPLRPGNAHGVPFHTNHIWL